MIIPNDLIIYQNMKFAFTVKVFKHGTIIRQKQHGRKFLHGSLLNSVWLRIRALLAASKKQKDLILVFGF